ncbi:MutS family DNA mismatch repair protein [Inconstantimicrobium mannanitabidum]|uniref:DNA mismatch repair protein n=1 Tax=Inconstantimicrobium mannanitabidum TaxID=1604901 RepID=A0ACB5R7C2_9CLOT|nr:MutS family DNA mismatch repair protein [Clostridium sp. TW13]GKX65084.1 DNA mismatch repair protein [Clostridium sp. TW13]
MEERIKFYDKKIEGAREELKQLKSRCDFYSILRFIIIAVLIVALYISYKNANNNLAIMSIVIAVATFSIVASIHSKALYEQSKIKTLVKVNEEAKARLNGEWKKFEDDGHEYLKVEHPYVNDLDIFGKSSLFQWVNTTTTQFGRNRLKEILSMDKLPTKEDILRRQSIIRELGEKVDFRQKVQIEGSIEEKGKGDPESFVAWAKESNDKILKPYNTVISFLCPILLIASIIIYFSTHVISRAIPLAVTVLNIIILRIGKSEIETALDTLYDVKYKISKYFNIINLIENESFEDENLKKLKAKLNSNGLNAVNEMKELDRIAVKVRDRGNMVYIIINILLLWDCHLLKQLELWRRKSGNTVEAWFEVIGEFEAYMSIANISGDFNKYSFPKIEDKLTISGKEIAHPLIGERAISNNFSLEKDKSIILITGSNMSGKSTFLRTVGINMILSYIGAPVCAKEFSTPILNIYTCMRIGDNLEENISSFYAEILRIKILMEAVNRGEHVFFLLDEIFKGTNSMDRHTGAEMLINQLSKKPALGFVSTHDLELCDLQDSNNKVTNYHFKEHYVNNEIKFDYTLRSGKSTTRNAVYLMRMAGIDI